MCPRRRSVVEAPPSSGFGPVSLCGGFERSRSYTGTASPDAGPLPPPSVIRALSVARNIVAPVLLDGLHRLAESTSSLGAGPPLLLLLLDMAGLEIERGNDAAVIGLPPEVERSRRDIK